MAWTTPSDQVTGHVVTAPEWNILVDDLIYLKGDAGTFVAIDNSVSYGALGSPPTNNPGSPAGVFLNSAGVLQVSRTTSSSNLGLTFTQPGADTQFVFGIMTDGTIQWGPGGSTARDTSLARTGAGLLKGAGVQSNLPTVGMGYAGGAGGSVTQATSKTTAVTLNTVTGQITMNAAALAASATAVFTVNCSPLILNDTVVINTQTGWFANYRVEAGNVAAGSFQVRITNISAGSLSDAVVLNYAVIKGSAS